MRVARESVRAPRCNPLRARGGAGAKTRLLTLPKRAAACSGSRTWLPLHRTATWRGALRRAFDCSECWTKPAFRCSLVLVFCFRALGAETKPLSCLSSETATSGLMATVGPNHRRSMCAGFQPAPQIAASAARGCWFTPKAQTLLEHCMASRCDA